MGSLHNYLSRLGPFNALGQNPRPNICFWALLPTIAPQNSSFSLLPEEKKWGFDFLSVNTNRFLDSHVWECRFMRLIIVTDVSKLAKHH